ncbi:site-2 protease family protein [Nocardiopsis sp. FIRDI 009]|uniref:site-2 protease family protein n=1 Tax=Nocardiopsis sp. FIRDI 009 TaxID=714197 RepID=UPI000E270754|nr:site-2 protease family protein [Nocardiopsis sp. FIRDI 009]
MPTPETPQSADTTDGPGPDTAPDAGDARGTDPWERMPQDALNVPDLDGDTEDEGVAGEDARLAETAAPKRDVSGGWSDFLPSPVFVLLLGLVGFAGWLSWTAVELDWAAEGTSVTPLIPPLLIVLGWIASATVHEFGHALAAYLAGDRSLRGSGYLRLNPFAFRETFGGLVLPVVYLCLGGLGLTGPPTYVTWDRVPASRRAAVVLAGPLASLVLSAALTVTVSVLVPPGNDTTNWAISSMAFLSLANLTAAVVNLLPIPGLDGFELLAPALSDRVAGFLRVNALYFSIAVFALLWFPTVNDVFVDAFYRFYDLVLPNPAYPGMVFFGQLLLRFWA